MCWRVARQVSFHSRSTVPQWTGTTTFSRFYPAVQILSSWWGENWAANGNSRVQKPTQAFSHAYHSFPSLSAHFVIKYDEEGKNDEEKVPIIVFGSLSPTLPIPGSVVATQMAYYYSNKVTFLKTWKRLIDLSAIEFVLYRFRVKQLRLQKYGTRSDCAQWSPFQKNQI